MPSLTLLPSAARTASVNTADQVSSGDSAVIVIDATAAAATPSVVFTVQGKDAVSGKYYTILASAAVTGISTTVLRVGPGLTAATNLAVNDIMPTVWRVSVAAGDADSLTYSLGASVPGALPTFS